VNEWGTPAEPPLLLTADMIVVPVAVAQFEDSVRQVSQATEKAIFLLTSDMVPSKAAAAAIPAGLAGTLREPIVLPATAPRLRPTRGVLLAMLLHGSLLAAVFLILMRHKKPPPPANDVVITMAMESTPAIGTTAQPSKPVVQPPAPVPVTPKPTPIPPPTPPVPVVAKAAELPTPVPKVEKPPAPKPVPPHPPAPMEAQGQPHPPHAATEIQTTTTPAKPVSDNPPLIYPGDSRNLGEEGAVLLKLTILPDGTAANVTIVQSTGFPRLDNAARDTVMNWHFSPALRNGVPVPSVISLWFLFHLH
jgi:protein TonB